MRSSCDPAKGERGEAVIPPAADISAVSPAAKNFHRPLSNRTCPVRLLVKAPLMEQAMSMFAEFLPLLDPKFLKQIFRLLCGDLRSTALGRFFGRLLGLLVPLDRLVRLTIRPVVIEAMASSDTLALRLGLISLVCTVLYAVSPISIIGAFLLAGYLGAALAAHVRAPSPLSTQILFGIWFASLVWGGLWWRGRNMRSLPPFRRWRCCIEN
jgi:hypothetical protein